MATMKIAGTRTEKQWHALRTTLELDRKAAALWAQAFDDYHLTRIKTRYFKPIETIEALNASEGEGFAVVALFCSLIEFLESTEQGRNFKMSAPRSRHEYGTGESRRLFTSFLENRTPFQPVFKNKTHGAVSLARSFYSGVRCGVLHDAQTCGGWLVQNEQSGTLLTVLGDGRIKLHRNQLKPMLNTYLSDYRQRLLVHQDTQDAFIRKWNHLCQP